MKQQTLKDVIEDVQKNWFGKNKDEEGSQDNCYKGLFWDLETKKFLRWNEFKQECKSTESKGS